MKCPYTQRKSFPSSYSSQLAFARSLPCWPCSHISFLSSWVSLPKHSSALSLHHWASLQTKWKTSCRPAFGTSWLGSELISVSLAHSHTRTQTHTKLKCINTNLTQNSWAKSVCSPVFSMLSTVCILTDYIGQGCINTAVTLLRCFPTWFQLTEVFLELIWCVPLRTNSSVILLVLVNSDIFSVHKKKLLLQSND